jgi:eukaryotic-like serine/threonine-protein kinase
MSHPPVPLTDAFAGRYTILRELGHGGMATVWLARDLKHARDVAIKVLRPELSATLGAERFLREIGIAARLAHPHVLPLIDSGQAGELLYYVSPFVEGGSLRERLQREKTLPVREVLRITGEVGSGLDYAHRSGVVHRDVKPENILFSDGHAVLSDFGVAAATARDVEGTITSKGIAVGTPEYMSPEQAGADSDIGPASDEYALACVVHELLTGAPPFRGANSRATMTQHVLAAPPPLRTLRPEVPVALERAVLRALSKDPAHRFPTVADFCTATRDPSVDAGGDARDRNEAPLVVVLPFVNSSPSPENEYLSDGLTEELIDALAKVQGIRVASRTSVFALKGRTEDVRSIGARFGARVVLEGSARRFADRLRLTAQLTDALDGRLLWSQRYDRTLDDVFAVQDELARTIVNTLRSTWLAELSPPPHRHGTDNVAAYGLYLRGRFEWNRRSTEGGILAAIDFFEQAIALDPDYALAYTGLSDCYALQVDYRSVPVAEGMEKAKYYARKALAIDPTLAEAHASLAWALFIHDWNWREAEDTYRRGLGIDPRYASLHQWYAFLLSSQGRFAEAIAEAITATELDPTSISARRSVGWGHFYARRYDEGERHLRIAMEMNPTAEETYRVLGVTLSMQNKHDEAIRVLREGLMLPGSGTYSQATLGWALARGGHRDETRAILADLTERARNDYVSPVAFAWLHIGLEQPDEVIRDAERAWDERRGWLAYLRVNPILDGVRAHPRFEALVQRMGL